MDNIHSRLELIYYNQKRFPQLVQDFGQLLYEYIKGETKYEKEIEQQAKIVLDYFNDPEQDKPVELILNKLVNIINGNIKNEIKCYEYEYNNSAELISDLIYNEVKPDINVFEPDINVSKVKYRNAKNTFFIDFKPKDKDEFFENWCYCRGLVAQKITDKDNNLAVYVDGLVKKSKLVEDGIKFKQLNIDYRLADDTVDLTIIYQ